MEQVTLAFGDSEGKTEAGRTWGMCDPWMGSQVAVTPGDL